MCNPVVQAVANGQERRTGDVNRFWEKRNYRTEARLGGLDVTDRPLVAVDLAGARRIASGTASA
ncbi:MAG: hypothetical protein WKF83_03420 [Nocardioidaceae bacterium]